MGGTTRFDRWLFLACGVAVCASAGAEPRVPESGEASIAHAVAEPPLRMSSFSELSAQRASSRALPGDDAVASARPPTRGLGLGIVELPPEGPPGARTRPRHALSMNSEAPQKMLRAIGVDATDCATRFRMPTKLQRDATGGSSISIQAQLGLACRF